MLSNGPKEILIYINLYFSKQCEPAYGRTIYSYLKVFCFFLTLGFFFSSIIGIKTSYEIIYKNKFENNLKVTQTYLYIYAHTHTK